MQDQNYHTAFSRINTGLLIWHSDWKKAWVLKTAYAELIYPVQISYFYSVSGQKWQILRHSVDICLIQALKISNLFEQ